MAKLERDYYVFRLLEEDKKLLKAIAQHAGTMHQAMEALAPIVAEMELPRHEPPKRSPVRVPIPTELKKTLQDASEQSGIPMVEIMLRAAREYHSRNG